MFKVHQSTTRLLILAVTLSFAVASLANGEELAAKFDGIGAHSRKISSDSAEAQTFFNQGLAFLYSFNHDEALRSFARAAEHAPECAAIHWAIALANGPHINFPMVDPPHAAAAWEALTKAKKFAPNASDVERDLIEALSTRYANPQPEDRKPLDQAYAAAMRKVWQKYPNDPDIGALFAEALMDLWPWDLWTLDGKPNADTAEVLKTLEAVLAQSPEHPLALHLYIHAMEASPTPEKSAEVADRLRELMPNVGHMVHMPSHIDARLGRWRQVVATNEKAIAADARYRERSPDQNFYRLYIAHNHHMLAFGAVMLGQDKRATDAINLMISEIPEAWLVANAPLADGVATMPYELHLRFGRWDAMLAEPEPKEILPIARAFWRYARGVAYAAKKQVKEARAEQEKFLTAKAALPEEAMFMQNKAADVLGVAEKLLEGEIQYREGRTKEAIASLQEAIRREDALRYIEPPDWIHPVRHVLGAVLLDQKRFADAEPVFREDLKRNPHNGWALFGLAASLRGQNKTKEADETDQKFAAAWKDADVKLTSPCLCLPGE